MSAVGPGQESANKMTRQHKRQGHEISIGCEVPLPRLSSRYPFSRMKVGDSFFVLEREEKGRGRVRSAIVYGAKKTGFKFTARSVKGGIRVWRIA